MQGSNYLLSTLLRDLMEEDMLRGTIRKWCQKCVDDVAASGFVRQMYFRYSIQGVLKFSVS
jgi:hypothetical protein